MIHFSQLLCRSWHLDAKLWACNCLFPTYHWSLTLNRAKGVHAHLTEHVRKHEFPPPYCWFQTNTTVFAFLFIVTFLFFWTPGNLGSLIHLSIWSISLSHQSPISYFLNGFRLPPPPPVEPDSLCSQSRQLGGALPYGVTWVPSGVS